MKTTPDEIYLERLFIGLTKFHSRFKLQIRSNSGLLGKCLKIIYHDEFPNSLAIFHFVSLRP